VTEICRSFPVYLQGSSGLAAHNRSKPRRYSDTQYVIYNFSTICHYMICSDDTASVNR
jgi:hypothetical protein